MFVNKPFLWEAGSTFQVVAVTWTENILDKKKCRMATKYEVYQEL